MTPQKIQNIFTYLRKHSKRHNATATMRISSSGRKVTEIVGESGGGDGLSIRLLNTEM